jgi:hypothetical protein
MPKAGRLKPVKDSTGKGKTFLPGAAADASTVKPKAAANSGRKVLNKVGK